MAQTRDFKGRVALITGGGSGIGRATALAFAKAGVKVVVADIDEDNGSTTASQIRELGKEAVFIRTDVSSTLQVEDLINEILHLYGRLDFAHNNAGIEGEPAKIHDCTEENWDTVINVNLKSVWICMKHELPPMINQGHGVIVNTSSVYGLVGCERGMAPYVASKHGIIGLTKTAALEYAAIGIRINAVCPGAVNTPFRTRLVAKTNNGCQDAGRYPIGRIAEVHEIAATVVWLCSNEASFITGNALPIDGGLTAR